MVLSDFQTQIDLINASLVNGSNLVASLNTEITTLTAKLAGTLTPEDATAALAAITDIATKLATLFPAPVEVA